MRIALLMCSLIACSSSQQVPEPAATQDPGPRSGLADDGLLRDLSNADRGSLCAWWATTLGGAGRMQSCSECSDGSCVDWNVSVSTNSECVAWLATLQCDATVREAEDCVFAQKPDLCASAPECDVLDGC